MKKILVVDDEESILDLVSMLLKREGYEVLTADSGNKALDVINTNKPDLVVLDLMLPDIDGHEVCKRINEKWIIPIIMLTAKGETVDKVIGLELGADDYLTKPFDNRELLARIKALLRRVDKLTKDGEEKDIIDYLDLKIDFLNKTVTKKGWNVHLTPREFQLLEVLSRNAKRVYSRDELMEKAWGYDYSGDSRAVDIYITRLRKKIEDDPTNPKYINTIYGFGYQFGNNKV